MNTPKVPTTDTAADTPAADTATDTATNTATDTPAVDTATDTPAADTATDTPKASNSDLSTLGMLGYKNRSRIKTLLTQIEDMRKNVSEIQEFVAVILKNQPTIIEKIHAPFCTILNDPVYGTQPIGQ